MQKKCLANLHALITLSIITQSQYRGTDLCQYAEEHIEDAGPNTMIHVGAQKFPNRLFRDLSLHCPDLMNRVIDVRKFSEDCSSGRPRQYAYLRRRERDRRGETFTFGIQQELRSINEEDHIQWWRSVRLGSTTCSLEKGAENEFELLKT